jgi:3-oxoacyl-[acyl-carrier protein] reductase
MDLGVRGRVYLVIGGTRGMGWETARLLAEDGANLVLVSRNPAAAQVQSAELADRCGVEILTLAADVTKAGSIETAIARSIERFGSLRGMAITNISRSRSEDFLAMDESEWNFFLQDVLMGSVRSCKAIIPHFIKQGGGQIVLIGAYSARAPKPYVFGFAAFKAALLNLTKNLAKTYGPHGIRVNCVCPGAVETERSRARLDALTEDEIPDRWEAQRHLLGQMKMTVALERFGQPAEVGEMIAFLLSERAAYATGLIANLDGGTDF